MADPRDVWLSTHFRLSDFLGNHSVYSRGLRNHVPELSDLQRENAEHLCLHGLEPLMERMGPLSVSYGLISPEFSRATITYQDPDKPSHHRWDLGAAADIVMHKWVQGLPNEPWMPQLFTDANTTTSPALLAHRIDGEGIPYSRLITYSESPYVCLAIAAREVQQGRPRRAFYENRFTGATRAKPEYLQMPTTAARARTLQQLQETGLPAPWYGGGFPSYHGGGRCQYQHMRVSKYTTVLDWLFNLKSISAGVKNVPALIDEKVQDAFAAVGLTYDYLIDASGEPRFSILRGYLCRSHPDYLLDCDWRNDYVTFELGTNESTSCETFARWVEVELGPRGAHTVNQSPRGAYVTVNVEAVLSGALA